MLVYIEDFMKSILHAPADWRARWGPVIRAVKRNPDFMRHYLEYRVRHEKQCTELEENYEPLLLMNDVTLRAAFPTVLGSDTASTSLPLTRFVHIVDVRPSDYEPDDGSSIPRLITGGKATRFPHACSHLTRSRRMSTSESHPTPGLLTTYTRRAYV